MHFGGKMEEWKHFEKQPILFLYIKRCTRSGDYCSAISGPRSGMERDVNLLEIKG